MMSLKKRSIYIYTLVPLMLLFISAFVSAQGTSGIIAPGATLTKIRSDFSFTEGPAADREGNIFFTDVRAERIYKWTYKDNAIALIREKTGQANGLMFDQKARLIICEMGTGRVTMDDGSGQIKVLAEMYEGQKLHSPNDLWIDGKGGIYFSDWISGRGGRRPAGATRKRPAEKTDRGTQRNASATRQPERQRDNQSARLQVYYITPEHKKLLRVTNDLIRPNGLIGSADGKQLYIADMGGQKTWVYNIQPDGTLTGKRLFCNQGSDGMTLDEQGNLYLTGRNELTVYNSKGEKIETINVPERPTNMTFCGKDCRTLFITARSAIYTLKMAVKGGPIPLDK